MPSPLWALVPSPMAVEMAKPTLSLLMRTELIHVKCLKQLSPFEVLNKWQLLSFISFRNYIV